MQRYGLKARLAAAAAMAVLIAGCEERNRPIDAPQPASLADMEAVSELPYAEPARVEYYEPARGYQWAERAYGLQRTFYDAPPDYGFYYDEVEPYVWETADDWALYAEPWGGDYRYYYYEPGADFPYFVRDYEYGYAFGPTGVLIAVFDIGGRYLSRDVVYRVAPTAGRYYARGHDLRRASREARRVRIDDRVWVTEGPRVSRSAGPWLRAARDDKAWRQWRERDGDRELQRFQPETRRRQAAAEAWRDRMARQQVATVKRRDDGLEADALRARRETVRDERREGRDAPREARVQADADRGRAVAEQQREQVRAEQRQVQVAREQARAEQQRAQVAAREQRQAEQRQAVAQQRQQAQAEARRAQQAEQRQAVAHQRQQAQAEARRAQQAEQRHAVAQQRQQAQAEQRRVQQAERSQAVAEQRQQQVRQARAAAAAADSGKPAATRERGGKDDERGRGKKD
ncbi:hypothetical protein [Phenylobacterium sp.]|uniref:hypothetical protein n=1 Tax=Phenylobacterium sp. TaxID=1871053 RepID=UPI002ED9F741